MIENYDGYNFLNIFILCLSIEAWTCLSIVEVVMPVYLCFWVQCCQLIQQIDEASLLLFGSGVLGDVVAVFVRLGDNLSVLYFPFTSSYVAHADGIAVVS